MLVVFFAAVSAVVACVVVLGFLVAVVGVVLASIRRGRQPTRD